MCQSYLSIWTATVLLLPAQKQKDSSFLLSITYFSWNKQITTLCFIHHMFFSFIRGSRNAVFMEIEMDRKKIHSVTWEYLIETEKNNGECTKHYEINKASFLLFLPLLPLQNLRSKGGDFILCSKFFEIIIWHQYWL